MRHNRKFNHLSRQSAHRKAMLANMASSLIESKRITTTVAKAKALRVYVEPLITKAKEDTTHSRRVVFSHLQNKHAVSELFRDVAVKVADRPGGYTRILRTGTRLGDNAEMCIIELVDYNETMLASAEEAVKTRRRRSRRGSGKKSETAVSETARLKADKTADRQTADIKPEESGAKTAVAAETVKEETVVDETITGESPETEIETGQQETGVKDEIAESDQEAENKE